MEPSQPGDFSGDGGNGGNGGNGGHDRRPGSRPDRPAQPVDHREHGLRDGLLGLRDLMDRLLGEQGCPWDRAQTLDSLRPYLLEEAHEVLEAMDDPLLHRKELGDLLFQIVFHSAIREREGHFDLDGVIEAIRTKMITRHPHVFAPDSHASNAGAEDRKRDWETHKRAERAAEGRDALDPLAGVPRTLPALVRSWRMQEKAAATGFDWPDVEGALAKLREEWAEFEEARASGRFADLRDEFGDLLFVLVRVGQKLGLDAEDALRRANDKFARRFAYVMRRCHELGLEPTQTPLSKLEELWQEGKRALAGLPTS